MHTRLLSEHRKQIHQLRRKNNVSFGEMGCKIAEEMQLSQDRDQRWNFYAWVTKLWASQKKEISRTDFQVLASRYQLFT
jgi:hypothetical protein